MTDKGVVDMSMGEVPLHKRNFEKKPQGAVQTAQTIPRVLFLQVLHGSTSLSRVLDLQRLGVGCRALRDDVDLEDLGHKRRRP